MRNNIKFQSDFNALKKHLSEENYLKSGLMHNADGEAGQYC